MTITLVPLCAMLAPCSTLSRTLRAGFAGAASGILDSVCDAALCPPAGRDEGMAAPVEQRDGRKKEERAERFRLTPKAPYKGWGEGRTHMIRILETLL
jgi:hypothetical protein